MTHPLLGTAGASPAGAALSQGAIGPLGFRDCIDGLSNTLLMAENGYTQGRRELKGNVMAVSNPLNANATPALADQVRDPARASYYIADGTGISVRLQVAVGGERYMQAEDNFFNTILPPNSPSICGANANNACSNNVMMSAGSYHKGGVHVLFGDGAVRFVTDNIDTGDKNVAVNLNNNSGAESPEGHGVRLARALEWRTANYDRFSFPSMPINRLAFPI